MNKKTKPLVPRLRFPEFRDAGEWEAAYFGDLGVFTGGGTPSKSEPAYWQGDIPWVSSSDISDESIRAVTITRFITKQAIKKSATKLIPSGSILLVSRVGVGKLAIIESPVCTSQDFTNFTPSKDSPIFLGYYLKSNGQALENLCQGMAIKGFTKEDISKIRLFIPRGGEQQKIADCLSSLDALIAAQAEKIDALKIHKKGLMQLLFPREGETNPRLRFPEFRDAGEWDAAYFGDLGVFTGGGTPSKSEPAYWQGDIPWVSSSDISDESIRAVTITRFITKQAIKKSATKLIPSGSILLVSRVGVGKLAIIESPVCTSQDFTNFTPSKDSPIFLGYYLKSNGQRLENLCQGMAIKGFTKEDISKMKLFVPRDDEQNKIADCISSLDELIVTHVEKLDILKTHKKGLMQQLFPSPEAVSV